MRRRQRGALLLPAVVLSALASAGVLIILLGAGAAVIPDHLPGIRLGAQSGRRSAVVTASPTPRPAPSRTPSPSVTPPSAKPSATPSATRSATAGPTATPTKARPTATATRPVAPPQPSCARRTVTLAPVADAYVDQTTPKRNFGSDDVLSVASRDKGRNRRALVRFALPVVPKGCTVTSATLAATARESSGRRLLVARAGRGWNEGTVAWESAPAPTGTAVSATVSGATVRWNVLALVRAGAANGFLLRDAAENARSVTPTNLAARQTGKAAPTLTITWA